MKASDSIDRIAEKLEDAIDYSLNFPKSKADKKPYQLLETVEQKTICFLDKVTAESVICRIKKIAKALFFGGCFSIIGFSFISLGILKPELLTITSFLFPLLFLSGTIQMIFWIAVGCSALCLGGGIFVGEIKEIF